MSKKKENNQPEIINENAESNSGNEKVDNNELPETITLSREEIQQVRDQVETLNKEKIETIALLQRLQADFDNYRKRNAALSAESIEEGVRKTIKALLPVLDNFDRAMDAAPEEGKEAAWFEGVKMVRKQLYDTLEKSGLSEIDAHGQFDPDFHNAVLQEEAEGMESGDIVEVLQKGYKVNDRIIRHTMVKVAK